MLAARQKFEGHTILAGFPPGAYGHVYKAEHETTHAVVAIKICNGGLPKSDVARFREENAILQKLKTHENVIESFSDILVKKAQLYYLMECADCDLDEALARRRLATTDEKLKYFLGICEGIRHAHGKGIVHRDAHPGNVLFKMTNGVGIAKLADFGLAKDFTTGRRSPKAMALWGYDEIRAPEIIFRIKDAEHLNDYKLAEIYSLGAILRYLFYPEFSYSVALKASIDSYRGRLGLTPGAYYALSEAERAQHYSEWLQSKDPKLESQLETPLPEVERGQAITQIVQKMCHADRSQRLGTVEEAINEVGKV